MDDESFFDCSSPFCFLVIEFYCTFSISCNITPKRIYTMSSLITPYEEWLTGDGESDWGIISRVTKKLWKEVKRVRKGEQARKEMVKDVSGQILRDDV